MKIALCHPSGTNNFVVAPKTLENLSTPDLKTRITEVKPTVP
jgi:hypothetical protein